MTTYYSPFYPLESADGAKGSAAFLGAISNAVVYLYKRSATVLTDANKPNGSVVYTFATGNVDVSAVTNGWTISIPSGTDPLYIVGATATGTDPTDTLLSAQWSTPVILAQNGTSGTSGLNSATIFLFQRSNSATLPGVPSTTTTYTFESGVLSGTLGSWSQTAPDNSLGKYLYVTTATAISVSSTDTILTTEWATVKVLAQNGAMGYTAYLTNETHTLTASSEGTVAAYTGATGQFKIYLDGVGDISSNFTLSTVSGGNPQGLVIAYTGNTYTVSSGFDAAEYTAAITIRATGSGTYVGVTLDKTFTMAKSKAGINGSPAKSMVVTIDRQLISLDSSGLVTPTSQTVNLTATKQNTTATVNWTIKDTSGNVLTPSSYLSNTAGDTTAMTGAQFKSAISLNGAQGVIITATLVDVITITDVSTIMKVQAPVNGTNGTDGAAALSAYITNEAQSLFAYANGGVVSFAQANGLFKVFSGNTEVTASATTFSATASGCAGTINTATNTPINGQPKGYYQVTAMSADTATLTLSCTYLGVTFTKIYTLSKTKAGYEIASALPTTDLFEGRMVFLTADDKLYRYTGTAWTASVAAPDLTGTIQYQQIGNGAIRAQHLLIAPKSLNVDPSFESGTAGWGGFVQRLPRSNAVVPASCPAEFASQFNARDNMYVTRLLVVPGESYKISGWVNKGTGGGGTGIGYVIVFWDVNNNFITAITPATTNSGWQFVTGTSTIPANTAYITFGPWADRTSYTGEAWYADLSLEKVNDASLIVNGAITADKINTNAVTTDKINAGAITSAKISVTQLSAISATVGLLRTATSGSRLEIENNQIRVYDGSNVMRVRMGIW